MNAQGDLGILNPTAHLVMSQPVPITHLVMFLVQVGEKLEMLKLLVEQRSEDDLKLVMTWLESQVGRRDGEVWKQMVGSEVPSEWRRGEELLSAAAFSMGEVVAFERAGTGTVFAKIVEKRASRDGSGGIEYVVQLDKNNRLKGGSRTMVKMFANESSLLRIAGPSLASMSVAGVDNGREEQGKAKGQGRDGKIEQEQKKQLDELLQRYGEQFEIQTFVDNGAFASDKDSVEARSGDSNEVELSEARRRQVRQWVGRRSDEDVEAFRDWFNDMYARHPVLATSLSSPCLSPFCFLNCHREINPTDER